MVGYADNYTRYTYMFYNRGTKKFIINRDDKWEDWKMTHPVDTLKIFREADKKYFVPGIEEYIIPTSEPEEKMPVHVIPAKRKIVRPNNFFEKS